MMKLDQIKLAIIGLGYVGLPLAVEFGKQRPVVGFDINARRIAELQAGRDRTLETEPAELAAATHLRFTTDLEDLRACNVFIVTVPTPIDEHKRPDLTPADQGQRNRRQGAQAGRHRRLRIHRLPRRHRGRSACPILEKRLGPQVQPRFLRRLQPRAHQPRRQGAPRSPPSRRSPPAPRPKSADLVDALYGEIITAGTHKAASIKVAEAAKVIENTQRDLNIALMNELALIFDRMGIDTEDVLAGRRHQVELPALPPRPGRRPLHRRRPLLPDPQGRRRIGYHPEMILAGRRINDSMGAYVVAQAGQG